MSAKLTYSPQDVGCCRKRVQELFEKQEYVTWALKERRLTGDVKRVLSSASWRSVFRSWSTSAVLDSAVALRHRKTNLSLRLWWYWSQNAVRGSQHTSSLWARCESLLHKVHLMRKSDFVWIGFISDKWLCTKAQLMLWSKCILNGLSWAGGTVRMHPLLRFFLHPPGSVVKISSVKSTFMVIFHLL